MKKTLRPARTFSTFRHLTLSCAALVATMLLPAVPDARAHETDQFLMPPAEESAEFADLGRYFSDYFRSALERGVASANARIDRAETQPVRRVRVGLRTPGRPVIHHHVQGRPASYYRSAEGIAAGVRGQLPNALILIDGLEWRPPDMTRYGYTSDHVVIYKPHGKDAMHTDLHFILDPRIVGRLWRTGTFEAYGTYLGADKIGHFVDMGYRYYQVFRKARDNGDSLNVATDRAINYGMNDPLAGENTLLGRMTAGAYSNADMASNYVGMLFYRNLTESVMLHGRMRPPMLELNVDDRWQIAEHVQNDPDFFRWFISDHYNEALNPSHFESGMQPKVRDAIADRWHNVAAYYFDEHGDTPDAAWFADKAESLVTYFGRDYGHCRVFDELFHLGNVPPATRRNEAMLADRD